jgi:hypothetical protein
VPDEKFPGPVHFSVDPQAIPDDEIEAFIEEAFEDELALAEEETGVRANAFARREAYRQVLLYWRKLRATAESVQETEVRLVLPNRVSPGGRRYNLEGVVDIIASQLGTMMYDLKTHEPEYVRAHPEDYAAQLDVYATIYEELKGGRIDGTGIVSTNLPVRLRAAIIRNDLIAIEKEYRTWEPLIPLPFTRETRDATINDFGRVVDCIEEGRFPPLPAEKLDEDYAGRGRSIGERVCQHCDIRYSCPAYRSWRLDGRRLGKDNVLDYFRRAENREEDEEYRYAEGETGHEISD